MKRIGKTLMFAGSMVAVSAANAQTAGGPDLTSLTSSVDMGTTIAAVLAVAATLAGLFVAMRGAKTVLGFLKGR
ncbi:hypothetical protein [Massilia varians]|uniref:hypothetical protein n=1 Tax=Massilia varians TaxID=457921 RepID=UPI002554F101|nr:hypothetical protein [Massilia varians]MDK6078651.1 hypothetical protein [Massilia varians]